MRKKRKEESDEWGERKENKKLLNLNSISVRTLSNNMSQNFETFNTPDEGLFLCFCIWCVKCAKYLAFDTFERSDENAFKYNAILVHVQRKKLPLVF